VNSEKRIQIAAVIAAGMVSDPNIVLETQADFNGVADAALRLTDTIIARRDHGCGDEVAHGEAQSGVSPEVRGEPNPESGSEA
jgi:hypothetical protein